MIQTSLTNLILYNLCGLLVLLGMLWVGRTVRTRLREYRRGRHRVVCGVCGHLFRNESREQAVECPACHRLVQRQKVLDV
jgi:hypothetical protein